MISPNKTYSFLYLTLTLCFSFSNSYAQEQKDDIENTKLSIEGNYHYGFIIPHHSYMIHLTKGHTKGYELDFAFKTKGDKPWHQAFRYPDVGFSVMYIDLSNPEELGQGITAIPYVSFPLIERKKIIWNLKFGYGIGIITKPFDKDDNFKNLAIGSKGNLSIHFNNRIIYKWSENIHTSAGFSFTHFSNGAYKVPNLGLNIPALNSSLIWNFGKTEEIKKIPKGNDTTKYTLGLIATGGLKEISPVEGPKYGVVSITADGWVRSSYKSKFNAGLDIFYNSSHIPLLERNGTQVTNKLEVIRPGVHLGYGLNVGKLSCFIQAGAYIFTKYKGNGRLYHRIGTRYKISERLMANLSLKTHFTKADFFEFGLGYQLKN